MCFSPVTRQPKSRIGRLFLRFLDHTRLDTQTLGRTPLNEWSVRLREGATCITQNKHKGPTFMPSAVFEPAIPTKTRLQTYSLDHAATRIGLYAHTFVHNVEVSSSAQIINVYIRYVSFIRKCPLFSGIFQTSSVFGFK